MSMTTTTNTTGGAQARAVITVGGEATLASASFARSFPLQPVQSFWCQERDAGRGVEDNHGAQAQLLQDFAISVL